MKSTVVPWQTIVALALIVTEGTALAVTVTLTALLVAVTGVAQAALDVITTSIACVPGPIPVVLNTGLFGPTLNPSIRHT